MKYSPNQVGVLPCAGSQTRMKELTFSKELLPLFDGRPVIQHSIDALRQITPYIVSVVHPNKKDLIKYLKKQHVSVIAKKSPGLPYSIGLGAQSYQKSIAYFALPDTFYQPDDVFVQLASHPQKNVIGLFNSDHPERYDSVRMYRDRITQYQVKVSPALSNWTMGCGKLSSKATQLLLDPKKSKKELIFGELIQPLVADKKIYGIKFDQSSYFDLGTPTNYIEYLLHRFPPS